MAMQLRARNDENGPDNKLQLQGAKLLNHNTKKEPKRAALGELGNRAVLRTVKDGQKELKDPKSQVNIKNAKARVDTFWKKPLVPNTTNITKPDGNVVSPKKKVVTRSASLKTTGTEAQNVAAPAIKQNASKPTTITAKVVHLEKVSHVRYIQKTKPESTLEPQRVATVHREESNLSRKSLSKLKASLKQQQQLQQQNVKLVPCQKVVPKNRVSKEIVENEKTVDKPAYETKFEEKTETLVSHSSSMLSEIENIDADDLENPILLSEYVNDIYSYLYSLEIELPIKENHLKDQEQITSKMRAVLIDWINEIHYQFHLASETFHMCVGIIDRYLQAVKDTRRQQLQLVGVTALFIASKYEELFPPEIGDFVYITDNTYTKEEILKMEIRILKTLEFNLARPLPIHFLRRFSKAASAEDAHHAMAKYFLELASISYGMSSFRPSEVAAASLYLALQLLNPSKTNSPDPSLWTPTLEYYSHFTAKHLQPIVRKIAILAKEAPTYVLKAVYNKYQSSQLGAISQCAELNHPLVQMIIDTET